MNDGLSESELERRFRPFAEKMADEGIPHLVIDAFRFYYSKLIRGEKGLLSRADIVPVTKADIPDAEMVDGFADEGRRAVSETVIIKLNGGLGTTMGLCKAKSLIKVKGDLNFLDIIARQILGQREKYGTRIPLVLMNSYKTDKDSKRYLGKYPDLASDIPLSFLQHKFPKVLREDLSPGSWPADPACEWNPPGHGEVYLAMITSGMLDKMISRGYKYVFISNSDNLGGLMDEAILGYFASHGFPFMMEVADRTEADIKGGHLARFKTGGLVLREIAQCPDGEIEEFQNREVYRYFNTNNIWVNLLSLEERLTEPADPYRLPMIINPKRIDSRDDSSAEVYQIETAMGSAISIFEMATAIRVPRTRFIPVKKSQDLLALWSDCYVLTQELGTISIDLDDRYYKSVDQLKDRFGPDVPSLLDCRSLRVQGNVYFGAGVAIRGDVSIVSHSPKKVPVPAGMVIDRDLLLD
jgi:UTP--glucose-1-phosphate uridylyltransferase